MRLSIAGESGAKPSISDYFGSLQARILGLIGSEPGISAAQVAERLGVTRAVVNNNVSIILGKRAAGMEHPVLVRGPRQPVSGSPLMFSPSFAAHVGIRIPDDPVPALLNENGRGLYLHFRQGRISYESRTPVPGANKERVSAFFRHLTAIFRQLAPHAGHLPQGILPERFVLR